MVTGRGEAESTRGMPGTYTPGVIPTADSRKCVAPSESTQICAYVRRAVAWLTDACSIIVEPLLLSPWANVTTVRLESVVAMHDAHARAHNSGYVWVAHRRHWLYPA